LITSQVELQTRQRLSHAAGIRHEPYVTAFFIRSHLHTDITRRKECAGHQVILCSGPGDGISNLVFGGRLLKWRFGEPPLPSTIAAIRRR
jgi:hypothetical protein